jgi:RNA polymerase subunit RPABC4/transcription elongation factor Spt4
VRGSEGKNIDDILASIMEGRSDQPEIFETLKNVAGGHRSTKDLLVADKPAEAATPAPPEEPEQQFLCPVCDTAVHPDDKVCPGCGAEFSEGESTEYECPVCKAAVPADADHCPSCGVRFETGEASGSEPAPERETEAPAAKAAAPSASRSPEAFRLGVSPKVAAFRDEVRAEMHDLPFGDRKLIARELPRLVNEVKPLLVAAKRIGVGIDEGKRLIANAVEAGKRKEMEKAVRLISDAHRSLDLAFVDFIGGHLEAFASEVEAAGPGEAANLARPLLEGALKKLGHHDYEGAWDSLQSARHAFASQAKEYMEGRKILESTERLMAEVRSLGMDTREIERLLRQGREAADRRDLPGSLRFARQSQERLLQAVPGFVQTEMREARNALLEMKVHGSDLTKPVGILKEASAHVKNEEWSEAIRYLKEFQKETSRAAKA